jgi:hypothetical protein
VLGRADGRPAARFARAIRVRDRAAEPAGLIGLEHEFAVGDGSGPRAFAPLLWRATLSGRALHPDDPHAHRLLSGSVVTADDAEAEASIPPADVQPGFVNLILVAASANAQRIREIAPTDLKVRGFSTHVSLSMSPDQVDAAASAYAERFGLALLLMTARRNSPGAFARPRAGRLELGGDYIEGQHLAALLAFAAGSARAIAAAIKRGRMDQLPPLLASSLVPAVQRYGWYIEAGSFGTDVLQRGRRGEVTTRDGHVIGVQEYLDTAWRHARSSLAGLVSAADLAAADALIRGDLPLRCELPSEIATVADAALEGQQQGPSPHGDLLRERRRRGFSVVVELATWDFAIFRLWNPVRRGFACVPRSGLKAFLELLDDGSLDGMLTTFLSSRPSGRFLSGWTDAHSPGLYDQIGSPWDFSPPERDMFGRPLAVGPGAYARGKKKRPYIPSMGIVVPPEVLRIDQDPIGRGWPWWTALIVAIVFSGLAIGYVGAGGLNAAATAQPTAVAVVTPVPTATSPSPSTPGQPTPFATVAPSPTPLPTPSPLVTPVPTPSPTPPLLKEVITGYCVRVFHEPIEDFLSYLDWAISIAAPFGELVDHFELTMENVHDDEAVSLEFDPVSGTWRGLMGLHEPGPKDLVSLVAVLTDGTRIDLTEQLIEAFGSPFFNVRFPQQDTKGNC